jgi:2-polyprenyl-3-methyl-5-hydroxy-6-metoxy-1,4-benzoquinol methylase
MSTTPLAPVRALEDPGRNRFAFGENWSRLLPVIDETRIVQAQQALISMLERPDLAGRRFLDVGCGSGLSSLAARRLGAQVHSFDLDRDSVGCTLELKRRHAPDDPDWTVERGSALDPEYMGRLTGFDIVYSWGVLHHTGHMWDALDLAGRCVRPGGQLFIALYNDTGSQAARWRAIKKTYNRLPHWLRAPFAAVVVSPHAAKGAVRSVLSRGPVGAVKQAFQPLERGMHPWRDVVDWVGGYPYEVAGPDAVFRFFRDRGFELQNMKTTSGLGCNEFVLRKTAD